MMRRAQDLFQLPPAQETEQLILVIENNSRVDETFSQPSFRRPICCAKP